MRKRKKKKKDSKDNPWIQSPFNHVKNQEFTFVQSQKWDKSEFLFRNRNRIRVKYSFPSAGNLSQLDRGFQSQRQTGGVPRRKWN